MWLVTGGAGYIGAHVVRALLADGQRVTVVDDLSTGFTGRVPATAQLEVFSILDTASLTQEMTDIGPDTVLEGQENYRILDLPTTEVHLYTTLNEQEVVFDGPSPYGVAKFPLIPVFGYFCPSFPEW